MSGAEQKGKKTELFEVVPGRLAASPAAAGSSKRLQRFHQESSVRARHEEAGEFKKGDFVENKELPPEEEMVAIATDTATEGQVRTYHQRRPCACLASASATTCEPGQPSGRE